jgi:membrane protein YqaA with SNARE-associated domain
MAISRKLTVIFALFYLGVIIYLTLFLTVPEIQQTIILSRHDITGLSDGSDYVITLLISFFICLIGNASIGFPIPYPFMLFSFSNSIYFKYSIAGLTLSEVLLNGPFWLEILGIAVVGGLGSALGELVGFLIGIGAKKIANKTHSKTLENIQGFGKLVLDHPKTMHLYIFIAAALPIPDDPLWIALGMSDKKINFSRCIIWAWAGKNITTIFYVIFPLLILLGFSATGIELNDISSVITESIMLLITLAIMQFILQFNWDKFLDKGSDKNSELK